MYESFGQNSRNQSLNLANDIFVNKFSVPKRQLHVLYYRGVDLRNGLTSTLKTAHDHGSKVKFLFVFVDPLF